MTFVTDPDNLDRFEVAVDPAGETLSVRGLGTERHAKSTGGDITSSVNFQEAGVDFSADGVVAGDILSIVSGANIGHHAVSVVNSSISLDVTPAFVGSTELNVTYKINAPTAVGSTVETAADGVSLQALYSFLKEEWRTFDSTLFSTVSGAEAPDLIQFNFPLVSITREQFEIGDAAPVRTAAWDFRDQTTRDLIRTAGWTFVDASGFPRQRNAGVVTLGALDSNTQVYYEQHDEDTDPNNFVLTGVVNQAIQIFDEVAGPDSTGTGFVTTLQNTITRNDSGDWTTDGFEVGGLVQLTNAEDAGNEGNFEIVTISSNALVVRDKTTLSTIPLTNNASDTTMRVAVDKREFTKLFARKKARTYAGVDISDIGVTQLENLVNRFPLAHVADPAITLDDGELVGSSATATDIFQGTEAHANSTTMNTSTGTNTFTVSQTAALTPALNDGVLRVGDSIELKSGTYVGTFEVSAINSSVSVDCFTEPLLGAAPSQTGNDLTWQSNTGVRDSGGSNAVLQGVDSTSATLVAAGKDFTADGGLGARTVIAGDMVVISAGTNSSDYGVYKVTAIGSSTSLTLNTLDNVLSTTASAGDHTYTVLRPGMHLQFKNEEGAATTPTVEFDPADATFSSLGNPPTIDRTAGSWIADGFVAGGLVTITDAVDTGNNDTFSIRAIATVGSSDDTLILSTDATLSTATADAITTVPSVGFVRSMNGTPYSFNWRQFGNGGTLAQTFEWIQRQLRRTTDLDKSDGVKRGDINDLLMTFASPTGTTVNMFIDDLASGDFNNVTKSDAIGVTRSFAFISGITVNLNANLTDDTSAKVVVFYTDPDETPNGNEYGTTGAIIVEDEGGGSPTPMSFTTPLTNPINATFDFDNNVQGGRNPSNPANITIVAIGKETAQYITTTGSIARQNSNIFSLVSALERNYSNP